MSKYRCMNCNYSFTPKAKDKMPSRCPYCAESNCLILEKSIIDDALSDREFD
ncbi:MAG: hypothetical protein N3D84_01160 [Candidatus Woesearchaeota archaeon]|nr:hypothetical protein [Candidatus Woesearchaeota archaeon]